MWNLSDTNTEWSMASRWACQSECEATTSLVYLPLIVAHRCVSMKQNSIKLRLATSSVDCPSKCLYYIVFIYYYIRTLSSTVTYGGRSSVAYVTFGWLWSNHVRLSVMTYNNSFSLIIAVLLLTTLIWLISQSKTIIAVHWTVCLLLL
jgi:hypothetical protein